jgi:DNA-3-methyladenine glycosylase
MDPVAPLSQSATLAAPALLGWRLITHSADGDSGGIIVETEAYMGEADPASHAYRGRTTRTAPMFEAAGVVYVYRSYGIHLCLNLVTGPPGEAQAVLIRALEPTVGLELMAARRHQTDPRLLTRGPGRVGQALGLSPQMSGTRLGQTIELLPPVSAIDPANIVAGRRVGLTRGVDPLWRFYLADSLFVSRA